MFDLNSKEAEDTISQLEARRRESAAAAYAVADDAIRGVRERGDDYVAEQIKRFDGVSIPPSEICGAPQRVIPSREDGEGFPATERVVSRTGSFASHPPPAQDDTNTSIPGAPLLSEAVEIAIERIESFHLAQLPRSYEWSRDDTRITHRVRPLRRVGIYVPGGRAVYVSTLIMCAVPARIAGVSEIVVATTPAAAGRPEFQYACSRLGVSQIYRSGGAAGVAALALGTRTLERVDKIVGPGNSYVTAAKARLVGEVGIDMTAGPTELIVIADETADPECVAADLLAQAEHGPDSAVICVATSREVAARIEKSAAEGGGAPLVLVANTSDAVDFANRIAPEHLSICTRDAESLAERVENCGAIFIGRSSPVAAGDYIIGSNHVLPTAGSARFFSPLGVYDFVKRSNVIKAGERDLDSLIEPGRQLADFEGLPLHGASLTARRAAARTS